MKKSFLILFTSILCMVLSQNLLAQNHDVMLGGNTEDVGFFIINSDGDTLFTCNGYGWISIGTTAPSEVLEIFIDPEEGAGGILVFDGNESIYMGIDEMGGVIDLKGYDEDEIVTIKPRVSYFNWPHYRFGIGTSTPTEQLEITGNFSLPITTATGGIIKSGSNRYIHNFGTSNFFAGVNAGNLITTGSGNNTGIGVSVLTSNTTGYQNTATGVRALYRNTTGNDNTATGINALFSNTEGENNTATGAKALFYNATGYDNTAIGKEALYSNIDGRSNTATGNGALYSNTTGDFNTATGISALYSNIHGRSNTATGNGALYSNTTGDWNTATGISALPSNTTGNDNTATGMNALLNNTTGDCNTATGIFALLRNTTGNYNTAVGYSADVASGDLTNATAIGHYARVDASNKVVIGNQSVTHIGGYADWSDYSDERLKENIVYKDDLGLDFIMKLNTVSFNYKDDENKRRRDGFIAQDVEAALNELGVEFSGLIVDDNEQKTMNLAYGNFVLPLINAVKEQQEIMDEQQKTIENLIDRISELEK